MTAWSCDVAGHAKKCIERHCELAKKVLFQVSTPHFASVIINSIKKSRKSKSCSQNTLKCFCLVRIGRPDVQSFDFVPVTRFKTVGKIVM